MVESVSDKVASGMRRMVAHSLQEIAMWPQVGQEEGRWRGDCELRERFKRPEQQDLAVN